MCARDVCFFLNQAMAGRIVPYLKEVRLAGNLPGHLQGTYVRMLLRIYMRPCYVYSSRHHVSSALRF